MPFPNFHTARIVDPDRFTRFATKELSSGITAIIGIKKDGSTEIQALRGDKNKISFEEFKQWIKEHEFKPIELEEAEMKSVSKNNAFSTWVEIDVKKAQESGAGQEEPKTIKIGGIISTDNPDLEGDQIDQDGLDFSYFLKRGWINYEHKQGMDWIVGKPLAINKVNLGSTKATNLEAELYVNRDLGKMVYKTMCDLKEAGDTRKLGFSIEGQVLARDKANPKIIRKSRVLCVSVCALPVNPDANLEFLARSMGAYAGYQVPSDTSGGTISPLVPQSIESKESKDDTILDAYSEKNETILDSMTETLKNVLKDESKKMMDSELDKMFDNHKSEDKQPVMISLNTLGAVFGKVFPQINKQKQLELARKLLSAASNKS
jgi:hypothetical protein